MDSPIPRPTASVASRPPRSRAGVALAVLLAAAAACRDAPTDPLVGLVAEESYAALALGVMLPDPDAWPAGAELDPETIRGQVALLGGAVERARALTADAAALPPHVAEGILDAGSALSAALEAEARGDRPAAREAVIRGADALRQVGPEAAARSLQGEVERRLGRLGADAPYSVEDLDRLGRLARGAREALDEGDWVLAIRRAFYAKGILDGNG